MPRSRAVLAALAATVLIFPAAGAAQQFKTEKVGIGGVGGTDYLSVDPATARVFVSRSTHVMVVDGLTGKVVGDIPDTPRVHGIAFAPKENHGFTTNAGDSTLTMFDLKTLAVLKKVHIGIDGADGIWYDAGSNTILSINHSKPMGTTVVVDAKSGEVKGTITLSGLAPEGGASDGKGRVFINIEDKNAIDVVDLKSMKVSATWSIEPCDSPTGIAYDARSDRIFAGCSKKSVVVDATSGKVVAELSNGDGVDALGWDGGEKLIYLPAGRDGNVTVWHQDAPDKYSLRETVKTFPGAKTIAVDEVRHRAYVFTPEYGPAPTPAPGAAAPAAGRGGRGGARGPIIAAWFITITH